MSSPSRFLVVNPNSSVNVTTLLEKTMQLDSRESNIELIYYTAPKEAPAEISGEQTSIESERIALPDIIKHKDFGKVSGILVCCYSDHPLIYSLAKHTSVPILGIMQATLLYSLSNSRVKKSFILTSFNEWEKILDKSVVDFVGSNGFPTGKFQRTKALDISVLSLSDPVQYKKIEDRVKHILEVEYGDNDINCVLLGCAGMAGLDKKLSESFPGVSFIDPVKVGVDILSGLARFEEGRN